MLCPARDETFVIPVPIVSVCAAANPMEEQRWNGFAFHVQMKGGRSFDHLRSIRACPYFSVLTDPKQKMMSRFLGRQYDPINVGSRISHIVPQTSRRCRPLDYSYPQLRFIVPVPRLRCGTCFSGHDLLMGQSQNLARMRDNRQRIELQESATVPNWASPIQGRVGREVECGGIMQNEDQRMLSHVLSVWPQWDCWSMVPVASERLQMR